MSNSHSSKAIILAGALAVTALHGCGEKHSAAAKVISEIFFFPRWGSPFWAHVFRAQNVLPKLVAKCCIFNIFNIRNSKVVWQIWCRSHCQAKNICTINRMLCFRPAPAATAALPGTIPETTPSTTPNSSRTSRTSRRSCWRRGKLLTRKSQQSKRNLKYFEFANMIL